MVLIGTRTNEASFYSELPREEMVPQVQDREGRALQAENIVYKGPETWKRGPRLEQMGSGFSRNL